MATRSEAEPSEFSSWEVRKYGDVVMCEFSTELEQIRNLQVRDDDVWICTFPRSGTTLVQEIVYLIQTVDFEKARTEVLEDRSPFIEILDPDPRRHMRGVKYVEELASPRVIKTHLHHFMLPKQLIHGNGKIVYLVRNPNACALSYYKLCRWFGSGEAESLREYMEQFLQDEAFTCPCWLHVLQYWEHRDDDTVLFLRFEELVQDKKNHIRKLADLLGKNLTEEAINQIDEHTDIANMKRNDAVNYAWHEAKFKTNKEYGGFINNGSIYGWRTEVPADIQERMAAMVQQRLGHTDLTF